MSPYDRVKARLPFPLYPFQQDTVNDLAPLQSAGYYLAVGCGKTMTSIASALYKLQNREIKQVFIVAPPILLTNWSRTLDKVQGVTHVVYRGQPKQRKALNLDVDFILMSYQILKNDFELLQRIFLGEDCLFICDEAQAIKNISTQNYKTIRMAAATNHLALLTGTPLSTPVDAYAYVKLISPVVYRNMYQFENIHVEERDFFGKPTKYRNLELLYENLELNSARVLSEEALKDLPPVTISPVEYDLDPKHLRLYQELADQQLKVLEDGNKIDLTNVSALFNALQQIPANAEHFSGGEIDSTCLELIDEVMDELGDGKLVIFTKYKMTNRRLLEHCQKYNVCAVWGEQSAKQQQASIDKFIQDPACRLILLQLQSASAGLDGLQHVCNNALFLELPYTAGQFEQAVGRVARTGQAKPVLARIALAVKTIQSYIFQMVKDKEDLVSKCVRSPVLLREIAMGKAKA